MNILAMDTTTKKANIALLYNDNIFSESIDNEITHSEKFLPLIDSVLKKANSTLDCIDLYGITTGPGSFTGVRIGISTVKAFAKVYDKDIFEITSLEVLAYKKINKDINNQYIVSLMDAKNLRVYYTIYKVNIISGVPCLENVIGYFNDNISAASEKIVNYFNSISDYVVTVTGDMAEDYKNIINVNATFSNSNLDARTIIQIIQNEIKLQKDIQKSKYITNYLTLDATYMRGSEAERTKYGEN